MGREARRNKLIRDVANSIAKDATDNGLLIEAGWLLFASQVYPDGMTVEQKSQVRSAFFAGSQHVFGSIMGILDPGEDPTASDLKRMDLIHHELMAFLQEFKVQHGLSDDIVPPETGARN